MGVGSGEQEGWRGSPGFHAWYKYSRERLKVLFFGLLSVGPLPPWKRFNRAFFVLLLLFFGLVFFGPPWKFFCRRPCRQVLFFRFIVH